MIESTVGSSIEASRGTTREAPVRVLHVDDDACFLKTAKQILEMHGAVQVETVSSAEEAVEKMKKEEYDVVVSDYQMPGKDGLQLLKELREKGNSIPFIVFTGKGREEVVIKALNLGADGYFNKTGSPETVYGELAHGIRQAVETKKARGRLRNSEQKFRCLVEDAVVGICVMDLKGRFIYVNRSLAKTMGYSIPEMTGRHFVDFLPSEDKEVALGKFLQTVSSQVSVPSLDFKVLRKDGHVLDLTSTPTRFTLEGKTVGFQAIIIDATKHKKADNLLRESEERYRHLFEESSIGIGISTDDGTVVNCNKAMQKITGYSLDELKKIKLEDTYENKESRKRLLEALGRHGSVSDYPLRLKRKGGSVCDALLSISQVTYDGQHLIQTLCQDVTERSRAEERIKKTSEEWSRTFDAITELVFVADRNYRIVRANKKLCEALKKKPEELLGKRCYEVVHGTEEPWPDCPYKRTLETKEATSAEINDPNLGMLLLVTNSPIFDERGELVQCVHVAKDISERREALERLRVVNEKLGVVGGLTRHDIRNKLSAVAANSYLAKKTLHNDHKAWAYLREIETACRQTTKILDFAAAYEKLGTEELVFVEVDKAFEEAVSLVQGSQDVEVVSECHGLTVLADSLLRQLFYNLIDNSLKHGQKVRRIRVHSEEEKNRIKLFYEDDGVGIPHAMKSKIFAGSSREGKGSGYGLHLIKKIMEVYGWTIEEVGEPGKGAKFVMTIPKTNPNGKRTIQAR